MEFESVKEIDEMIAKLQEEDGDQYADGGNWIREEVAELLHIRKQFVKKAKDSRWSCPDRRRNAVCQTYGLDPHCVHCGENTLGRSDGTLVISVMNDIFDGQPNKCIMVQQVNCRGKMGSGLAKAIREKYPMVYEHYRAEYELGLLELGYTSYIEVEENKFVANICGQDRYGYDGKQYTNYEALRKGLEDVKMMAHELNVDVVIPYRLGCGLGGGDWNYVSKMIDEVFKGDLVAFIFQGGDENYGED
jgi:O-acetyl-ADP-ribose deacetylase (regulator of RNase III)